MRGWPGALLFACELDGTCDAPCARDDQDLAPAHRSRARCLGSRSVSAAAARSRRADSNPLLRQTRAPSAQLLVASLRRRDVASFPAASASVHHEGANSSRTSRPPAASAAAPRALACSGGTQTATWIGSAAYAHAARPSSRTEWYVAVSGSTVLSGCRGARSRATPARTAPPRPRQGLRHDQQGLDRGRIGGIPISRATPAIRRAMARSRWVMPR